ncbi:hypothetical protein STEG23_034174, partial [Scotinomys teguina]
LNSDLEGLKMEHEKEMSDMNKFLEEISEALHKCKEPNENTNSYRTLHSRLLSEWSQSMEKVSRLRESNRKLKEEQTMLQESCENTKRLREEVHEMICALWTKQKQEHQVLEDNIQLLQKQKALLIQQRDLAVKEQHPFTVSQMRFENCQQELEQMTAQDDSLLQMELLEQKHHVPENTNQIHKDPDIHQQMAPVRGKITSEEDMWTRKSGYCKIKQPREKERENGDSSNIENEESANQDLQNRLLNLESANLMQELQSINNKCIAKIGFVDNKYEYLMDRTLTLQSEVVTTQTLCKEERLSLTDKIRSLESCVSEEHNRWYDSMKNLESQAREEVHSLEQTLCARLQALEETLCKHDKEPNKQKGKTIKVVTSPNGSNPMAYPVIVHERPADDTHPEPYVTHTLQPISIRDFKNMKEAIVTYGIHSTYVKQMLNSWSTSNRIIPDDWHQLTSAVLEYSQQLQWKSWLREEARNLEQQDKLRGFEISQDQILGEGHFADRNIQATYDEHTISLCRTAALNAWEKIPEPGKQTEVYTKIFQGPPEPFTDFLQRLTTAIKKAVSDTELRKLLTETLAFNNAKTECKRILTPLKVPPVSAHNYLLDSGHLTWPDEELNQAQIGGATAINGNPKQDKYISEVAYFYDRPEHDTFEKIVEGLWNC